ncbi:metalloregulator ArsR/SmtB family transcription factor [Pseudomonas sp. NW5]|uniref:ArsR/SmtB family transcription factor n=1 Tax=Pseudomonas sp. NW5 TaxID=2934934 RepID=UPI0020201DD7|nr:metalloregulator ArsR/SmtB family transcription factor [Pseudomonas sp. NW5]MCL7461359.1 metalloregulator ArsR/SmtB family transcription factor [Pseudomonas sp. NW5]
MSELSLDLPRLQASAERAAQLLRVLGNPDRLLLLCQLAGGERSVGELQATLGILQPTLSQQLAVLRREALVSTRRDGKQIHYQISDPEALAVIGTLYHLFCPKEDT